MNTHRTHRGFALLMTLVLVLIAGTMLTGIARLSTTEALHANNATEDLQRRWAMRSATRTLLPRAEMLLNDAEGGRERLIAAMTNKKVQSIDPVSKLHVDCTLGDIAFRFVFTDEQAKLNVNRVIDEDGPADARRVVTRLLRASFNPNSRPAIVRLRPAVSASAESLETVGSFGQVLENAGPETLFDTRNGLGAASRITCWGNGDVNLRRVSPDVLHALCDRVLGRQVVRNILKERDKNPHRRLSDIFKAIDSIDDDTKRLAESFLTDDSTCHALWIEAQGHRRAWHAVAIGVGGGIDDFGNPSPPDQVYEIAW